MFILQGSWRQDRIPLSLVGQSTVWTRVLGHSFSPMVWHQVNNDFFLKVPATSPHAMRIVVGIMVAPSLNQSNPEFSISLWDDGDHGFFM